MMLIALIFLAVGAAEWRYLRARKRKKRYYVAVLGTVAAMLAISEMLYMLEDTFQLAVVVEAVFGPLERWLVDSPGE